MESIDNFLKFAYCKYNIKNIQAYSKPHNVKTL